MLATLALVIYRLKAMHFSVIYIGVITLLHSTLKLSSIAIYEEGRFTSIDVYTQSLRCT